MSFHIMDIMDGLSHANDLNSKFHAILNKKKYELQEIFQGSKSSLKSKTEKMIGNSEENSINVLNFNVKTTLAKIAAEQDRKLKMSKAYKKKELDATTACIQVVSKEQTEAL